MYISLFFLVIETSVFRDRETGQTKNCYTEPYLLHRISRGWDTTPIWALAGRSRDFVSL